MCEEKMSEDVIDEIDLENFESWLEHKRMVCFIAAALMYVIVFFLWWEKLSMPIGKITFMGHSKLSVRTWQEAMELMAFCFMPEIIASILERCHRGRCNVLSAISEALRNLTGAPAMAAMGVGMSIVVLGAEAIGVAGKVAVTVLAVPMLLYAFIVIFQHLWSVGTAPQWER